jgi:hypothetical protein
MVEPKKIHIFGKVNQKLHNSIMGQFGRKSSSVDGDSGRMESYLNSESFRERGI